MECAHDFCYDAEFQPNLVGAAAVARAGKVNYPKVMRVCRKCRLAKMGVILPTYKEK